MAKPLTLRKPASTEHLALFLSLVDVLAQRHGLPPTAVVDLRLLAEEACVNVVHHAFPQGEPGELSLSVSYDAGVATIVLEDDGAPFDPSQAPEPVLEAELGDRPIGGLGWHLIRTLADDVAYARHDDRNRLTLTKSVGAA
jgi:serine/threonine-protein kinase RsbW